MINKADSNLFHHTLYVQKFVRVPPTNSLALIRDVYPVAGDVTAKTIAMTTVMRMIAEVQLLFVSIMYIVC